MCTRSTAFTAGAASPAGRRDTETQRRPFLYLCVSVTLWLVAIGNVLAAQSPNLGKPITEADLAGWDISILPDGGGLPAGSGTPEQGAKVFAAKCALCHGPEAKGGTSAGLVGGPPLTNGIDTPKSIANFWPSSTTLFDFIRRAMPWQQPRTLTNDEVYALTAYILSLNKITGPSDVMNAQTLPKVRMPNREGFLPRFPERMP
jgi:S-disulfanyl-L-cysteine oxidoreductase SoxD